MKKLLIGGAAAALVVAIAPAIAQPAPPPPPGVASGTSPPRVVVVPPEAPGMHMAMSYRAITRDEALKHVRDLFARLDTNRDGFITKQEVEVLHNKMPGMEAMHGEFRKRFAEGHSPMPDRAAMFDKLDTNHDGSISRAEFMAALPQLQERRVLITREGAAPAGAPGVPGETGMMMRMHGTGMHAMGFGGHLFEMADANHDGRVSLAEAEAAALAHFDRGDLNHDGKITPEERQQAHELMRQHHPS